MDWTQGQDYGLDSGTGLWTGLRDRTMDWTQGQDYGLDFGLDYGLDSGLKFGLVLILVVNTSSVSAVSA